MKQNKTIKNIISIAIFILFIFISYLLISKHPVDMDQIKNISVNSLIICVGLFLMGLSAIGLSTQLIIKSFDIPISFNECFSLTIITSWSNYLMPLGGMGVRATYLKNIHKLPYSLFLSTLMASYIIHFFTLSTLGLSSLYIIFHIYNTYDTNIFLFLLVILLFCALFILFNSKMPIHQNNSLVRHISRMINGWQRIKQTKELLLKLFIISIIRIFLFAALINFSFLSYNYEIKFTQSLFISILTSFSLLIKITPGSFGFQEGTIFFASRFLGFSPSQGILVAGFVRLSGMICIFSLGPIYSYLLTRHKILNRPNEY